MTKAEKRRRFQRFLGWIYIPMIAVPALVHNALKVTEGKMALTAFLSLATILVLAIFVGLLIPWAEERRLRRLAEERRESRRQPLSFGA